MSPIMFKIGSIGIRWYSVLILISFVIGYILVITRARKQTISGVYITDLCLYLVIFCIIGARLYYCLFNMDYYKNNMLEILMVWKGGLAIHGGIIAGIIVLLLYTRKFNIGFFRMTDIIAPALALGQAIGRWGNFFNQEAYGPATTIAELQRLHVPKFVIDGMYIDGTYHHPTFLYESLACLLIFIIIMIIRNSKHIKDGQVTGIYFIIYGVARYFIESLRQDSLYLGTYRVAQLVSITMIAVGIVLIIVPLFRRKYDQ